MTSALPLPRRLLALVVALFVAAGLAGVVALAAPSSAGAAARSMSCQSAAAAAKLKAAKAKKAKKHKKHKKSSAAKRAKAAKAAKAKKAKRVKRPPVRRCVTPTPAPSTPSSPSIPVTPPTTVPTSPGTSLDLGPGGLVAFPDEVTRWVANNPNDPRTPTFRSALVGKASSLWLTGDESFGNLAAYAKMARDKQGTMSLAIWNIPLRWDGLSTPSTVAADAYKTWLTKIAQGIGTTRAVLVLEPDALWFYDRLPNDAARKQRLDALATAITALRTYAPNTRVYLEAGTSSGSVTPERMGQLLELAGVRQIAGFAVNVSSFSPAPAIEAYAGRIRAELQRRGLADPRYVVDTSRNGAPTWNYTWCNPDGRRVGAAPGLVGSASGLDLNVWVKAPGTSDGDCGNGRGSYGGQFLPAVAYQQLTGS